MASFLDKNGLSYFYSKLVGVFRRKDDSYSKTEVDSKFQAKGNYPQFKVHDVGQLSFLVPVVIHQIN